ADEDEGEVVVSVGTQRPLMTGNDLGEEGVRGQAHPQRNELPEDLQPVGGLDPQISSQEGEQDAGWDQPVTARSCSRSRPASPAGKGPRMSPRSRMLTWSHSCAASS